MIIVLEYSSKDNVEAWEAWITILMFPMLVGLSYGQDIGWACGSASVSPEEVKDHSHVTVRDAETHKKRRPSQSVGVDGAEETAEDEAPATEVTQNEETVALKKKKKSRLEYRIQATRKMTGGKRVMPTAGAKKQEEETAGSPEMTVSFGESSYSVLEGCGTCKVKVVRSGIVDQACTVQFDTSDGTALSGNEYVQTMGVLDFKPGTTEREIEIEIIDDNEWAPDKNFFVRLFNPVPDNIKLAVATCQIIILNDDDPGVISFDDKTVHAMHTANTVSVPMNRKDGCDGNVLAFVKLLDGTAKAGVDYEALTEDQEEIHFNDQERAKTIDVTLKASETTNKNFTVQIMSVEPEGAQMGAIKMCTVIITDDKNYQKLMEEVVSMMDESEGDDNYKIGTSSWAEQFQGAMNMEGDGEGGEPACMDYVMHVVSFYWKVLHAFIPPTDKCGGWATFFCALAAIGVITAFIGDFAKMFGCCVGLEDGITAITFVALGTSLPDTFASVEATVNDDTADAAITNVTGSNSVNVFLGLGLPWVLATVYHSAKTGNDFAYPAGDLVFSVFVFFGFAFLAIGLLTYRRFYLGGELGGPKTMAWVSSGALALFWITYIIVSSMKTKGHI